MIIKFNPTSKDHDTMLCPPQPSKNYIPDWFKKQNAFENNKIKISENGLSNATAKMCMPFNDALRSGYIQKTWCDIFIQISDTGQLEYFWSSGPQILKIRNENYGSFPNMPDYYPIEFVWNIAWMPELPKGYSALITHPLNRIDLPFYTLSGIIDSDKYKYGVKNNQFPFYIKNGFNGLIPEGTPMYQIIPIKRDSWKSKNNQYNEINQIKEDGMVRKKFWGGYKKYFWSKKIYN